MHPANPYRVPPDFLQLSEAYKPLRECLFKTSSGVSIDFKDENSQRCSRSSTVSHIVQRERSLSASQGRRLTEALLHRDFGLRLHLPLDRLCPPVPNRLNYVLWIRDIVYATYMANMEISSTDPSRTLCLSQIQGIDVGTGASVIYPLLACRLHRILASQGRNAGISRDDEALKSPEWHIIATDVDETSLRYARQNVQSNGLDDRIRIVESKTGGPILSHLFTDDVTSSYANSAWDQCDFVLCNPPFYASEEEIASAALTKEEGPRAVCTGGENEMITPGGEVAFVSRMVDESVQIERQGDPASSDHIPIGKPRCHWYTSMLGKLSSVVAIVDHLRRHTIDNYVLTEFVQGQTRRWAVGWSFGNTRLPDSVARIPHPNAVLSSILPRRNTTEQTFQLTPLPMGSPDEDAQPVAEHRVRELTRLYAALRQTLEETSGLEVHAFDATSLCGGFDGNHPGSVGRGLSTCKILIVDAAANTWSRAARRKAQQASRVEEPVLPAAADLSPPRRKRIKLEASNDGPTYNGTDRTASSMRCRIWWRLPAGDRSCEAAGDIRTWQATLQFDWLRGGDKALYASFCSHVCSKLAARLKNAD